MNLRHLWDRLTGWLRDCRIEDGYCLNHHTSTCTTSPEARRT